MRKTYLAYLLLCLLSACGSKEKSIVRLSGEIKGLGNDTLYLYGMDGMYDRMNTLPVKEDKFSVALAIDTLVSVWLQFNDSTEYPLYLNKGNQISIKGSAAELTALEVTGNLPNEELTAFLNGLKGIAQPSERALEEKAEDFINEHPASLASLYLLDKYFVQKPQPDLNRIERMTERMTGELKDRPYMEALLNHIQEAEKGKTGKSLPHFTLPNAEGTSVSRSTFKDKYLLVHFWASWNQPSLDANAALRRIYKQEKKSKLFALWGISLDLDRKTWEATIQKDTLEWEQSCDFAGWNTAPAKQLAIQTLPANLLITPSGRIEGKNLSIEEIEEKVEKIKQEEKEKEERKKEEARKKRKRY